MKKDFLKRALIGSVIPITLALTACGTPAAKDYGGTWKSVNRFREAPSEIPLNQTYAYFASPMDETLRTMLRRWAKDSGMQFSYHLQSDYTLFKAVTDIHTTDVYAAASQLTSIYAAQGVSVSTDGHEILVKQVRNTTFDATGTEPQQRVAPASAK